MKYLHARKLQLNGNPHICLSFRLEVAAEPWIDGLFPALKRFLDSSGTHREGVDSDSPLLGNNTVLNSDSQLNDFQNGQKKKQSNSSNIAMSSFTADLTKCNNENLSDLNNSNSGEPPSTVCDVSQLIGNHFSTVVIQATCSAIQTDQSSNTESGTEMKIGDFATEKFLETCITVSVPPLSESTLTVPFLPPAFLQIEYLPAHSIVSISEMLHCRSNI